MSNMQSNKKGFTLIEIVVSMALLGIIAVSFLSAFTTYYAYLYDTRETTQRVFDAQMTIEEAIESIKSELIAGAAPSGSQDFDLFTGTGYDITVTAYYREALIAGSRRIKTFVGDTRLPDYVTPSIATLNMWLRDDGSEVIKNYEYVSKPNQDLLGKVTVDNISVFLLNRHEWYVSREGFNIPYMVNASFRDVLDYGRLYPIFPDDYIQVPVRQESSVFNQDVFNAIVNEYVGRHIVYSVTPYALNGKKGDTSFSYPIFLHGPAYRDGLTLHLEASLISKDTAISDLVGGNQVRTWPDMSGNGNDALQTTEADMPVLVESLYQEDVFVWGKELLENTGNTHMTVDGTAIGSLSEYTLFFVFKSDGVTAVSQDLINCGNDALKIGWDALGDFAVQFEGQSIVVPAGEMATDQWQVVSVNVNGGNLTLRVNETLVDTLAVGGSTNFAPMEIAWHDAAIAELLLYDAGYDTAVEFETVRDGLINKYDPDPLNIMVSVLVLKPMTTETILKNTTYTLPSTADAVMNNGSTQTIDITWSGTVDTAVPGTYTLTAASVMNPAITTTKTVHVLDILSLVPTASQTIEINEGEDATLVTVMEAELSDGSSEELAVAWRIRPPVTELSVFGNNVLFGANQGTYLNALEAYVVLAEEVVTMPYDVVVRSLAVTGINLVDYTASMMIEDTYQWVVEVEPDYAANKNLIWQSSDTSVATVVDGLVTAVGGGSATITVTSEDNSAFTHSVVVNVTVPSLELLGIVSSGRNMFSLSFSNEITSSTNPRRYWFLVALGTWSKTYGTSVFYNYNWETPRGDHDIEVTDEYGQTIDIRLNLSDSDVWTVVSWY